MSELQNPLFDEEKEFLERKKLEYERALRGDVDHIKDQSVVVGKVALVGVGLVGGIWLIVKAFGGKKRKRRAARLANRAGADQEGVDTNGGLGTDYFTAGNGKRYKSTAPYKSAAASALVFQDHHEETHESDDLGFGSRAVTPASSVSEFAEQASPKQSYRASIYYGAEGLEDDPFRDLPYDDSRRLPASHAFDEQSAPAASRANSRSRLLGSVLQAFLQSDTGKVLVAQVAAVGLALVTKKVGEFFPAAKNADLNSDLAATPGQAPAQAGDLSATSPAPSVLSDASNSTQSL